jgi:hypothetical protein
LIACDLVSLSNAIVLCFLNPHLAQAKSQYLTESYPASLNACITLGSSIISYNGVPQGNLSEVSFNALLTNLFISSSDKTFFNFQVILSFVYQ